MSSSCPWRRAVVVGMIRVTRPGRLILVHGDTPAQIAHGTGGPKAVGQLHARGAPA
ncbi:hypothetical protein KM176_21525 [Pseudooceanicola sp. CBS1P-1]|uniref:Uncharacterized protein n=1 Tax=Pseudooceanicola albus TaxID=2692189 RepID=A0A6L7G8H4_9RHOB|nr:hypothetical protein [Pseudooceanicola endophyticus]MBT9386461.1 hypothetical protein [Pseudooceanicola endophyticus]MXN20381.1 hypothetical protein [Pseudooceanicola albus]